MKYYVFVILFLSVLVRTTQAVNPQVTLQIAGGQSGTIVLELYKDKAPITVANFLNYVQSGFYNGLIFHRVIEGFMVQGGGFDIDLKYKTPSSSILNESTNGLSNRRGTIAMARSSTPHSATSQFFINHGDNEFLDFGSVGYDAMNNTYYYWPGYCVFGHVISGMDVVDNIAEMETGSVENPDGIMLQDVPIENVIIQSATITLESPVCAEPLKGDINGDCVVDLKDLYLLAKNWMSSNQLSP